MSEIEIKHLKSYSELINSLPEDERKCAEIMCKQSAEVLEERLFLAQLYQSKNTYLVCFENGFNYGNVSAFELYTFMKLKIEYNNIHNKLYEYTHSSNSNYLSSLEKFNSYQEYLSGLESQYNVILKAAMTFVMPIYMNIEKIIDETTNTVVKI